MLNGLRHRGPDGMGEYFSANHAVGLAHTRLSILDPTEAGKQPMGLDGTGAGDTGRWWITFNGEVYNFRELRKEMEGEGVKFVSEGDTEVVLRLFEREKEAGIRRLKGMFALAIWDDWEGECFLARDPLGIKPLYFAETGGSLVFASELRALMDSGWVEPQVNAVAVAGYLAMGSVPEPETLVAGVNVLPAGGWLRWKAGRSEIGSLWELRFGARAMDWQEAVERVRCGLLETVARHLVSDVPVGLFLSGGMDSSALLALASVQGISGVKTFSIRFKESGYDEGTIAEATARRFGADHREWRMSPHEGRQLFQEYLGCCDQPSIDGFNTFAVSRITREAGLKVALSGVGGDELFHHLCALSGQELKRH